MRINATYPRLRQEHQRRTRDALVAVFTDQQYDVLTVGRDLTKAHDDRLTAVVFEENTVTASRFAGLVAKQLRGEFDPERMMAWLQADARSTAANINDSTRADLAERDPETVFDTLLTAGAARQARSMVTRTANFGAHEAVEAIRGDEARKTWIWSGKGARHSELSGQTVPLGETFSNGMKWPGDTAGGAENVANCQCSIAFGGD